MPDFKGLAKGGWHPSWDNKVSINKTNYKNPKGWVGKKEDNAYERAQEHVSAPLSSLRDPSSFAPPPKHVNYHGADAVAAHSSGPSTSSTPVRDTRVYDTDRGGLGGALGADAIRAQSEAARHEQEEAERPKPPPVPYRVDTSGLRTDNLPPPPVRRNAPSPSSPAPPPRTTASPSSAGMPQLPPRLPRRQNSNPNEFTPPPPPSYGEATRNPPAQDHAPAPAAASRLGAADITVPSLGINRSAGAQSPAHNEQVSELQSRFKNLRTTSPTTTSQSPTSSGPSFSQASSALATARQARADPSSISLAQAREAASTANQVNNRYGAQIGAGLRAASDAAPPGSAQNLAALAAKKKPPPPPAKSVAAAAAAAAPPVPVGSKPRG
ncbi:hypothetical protein ANO11243_097000 [Dothideomycetidae sp. 11243]|nr:hypothetical protein ANO11243_097000 [fungal sp. No.11243]